MSVRVGLIGSGFMGRTWAEVAANHVEETTVVAVAGGSRTPSLAADYGAEAMASPEALVARDDIELVIVTTPQPNHHAGVILAANAGKHVLVEKPMAVNRQEGDEMVAAAKRAGVKLAVVSQHRFRASPVFTQKLIREGAVGELRMVRAQGAAPWAEGVPVENEPIADMGFHVLDLLRGLVDSPAVTVFGRQASYKTELPARQSTMALLTFENGVMADVWVTYEIPEPGFESMMMYLITGSKAMIRLDSYGKVELGDETGWQVVFEQPAFDPNDVNDPIRLRAYADELRDVIGAIRDGGEPLVNGGWARDTMELIDAIRQSGDRNEAIRLPM